ncbi:hypothetical protein BH10BAC5_BH10BAC5_27770 [soil metagenome]
MYDFESQEMKVTCVKLCRFRLRYFFEASIMKLLYKTNNL